jgi:hypothetical protein
MLFERQDYSNLLEQELLSEECQIFTEAFLDERYDEIDYEVPVLEVVALHDIVSKISALQDGILEEEIAVYADHETIDDYILSLMEFYEVEDPETLLETAQEILDEGAGKIFKSGVNRLKKFYNTKITGKEYANAADEYAKSAVSGGAGYQRDLELMNKNVDLFNNSLKGKFKGLKNKTYKNIINSRQAAQEFSAKNPKLVKGVKTGAGVGALGATGAAGYSVGQNTGVKKGFAAGNEAGFKAGVASVPKPVPAPSVYDRVKGMGSDAKRAIMNNKGLALKTLGGTAAAGGLGYLAYKLWKNRNKKKAAAKA